MIRRENVHFQIIVTKNVKFPIFYDNAASAHVVEQNLCHLDFSKLLHGILKIDTCISVVNKNEEIKYMLLIFMSLIYLISWLHHIHHTALQRSHNLQKFSHFVLHISYLIIFPVWGGSPSCLHMSAVSTRVRPCLQSDKCHAQE